MEDFSIEIKDKDDYYLPVEYTKQSGNYFYSNVTIQQDYNYDVILCNNTDLYVDVEISFLNALLDDIRLRPNSQSYLTNFIKLNSNFFGGKELASIKAIFIPGKLETCPQKFSFVNGKDQEIVDSKWRRSVPIDIEPHTPQLEYAGHQSAIVKLFIEASND